jgi:kynurenine 3-monooxygenase
MAINDDYLAVIGGGLAGPLLAILLADHGYHVRLFERRGDVRIEPSRKGRSINLALSNRGIEALKRVGLWEIIRAHTVPMRGRCVHLPDGTTAFHPYSIQETDVIYSTSRSRLNLMVLSAVEERGVNVAFGTRCTGFDSESRTLFLRDESSFVERTIQPETVFAADGASSVIRQSLARNGCIVVQEQDLGYAYKELTIPPGPSGQHALEPDALHIWPRDDYMLIALPNCDGSFSCTLFLPLKGRNSFADIIAVEQAHRFFSDSFPDLAHRLFGLAEEFVNNPLGSLRTIKCAPWNLAGDILLIGDAAHTLVPFYGQGVNCAFEDCLWLTRLIEERGRDWAGIFSEFSSTRLPDAEAISELSLENFLEMRAFVANPRFLLKKECEQVLEREHPYRFRGKYSLVTFTSVPYSKAAARGRAQDEILEILCDRKQASGEIDWRLAESLVNARLPLLDLAQ